MDSYETTRRIIIYTLVRYATVIVSLLLVGFLGSIGMLRFIGISQYSSLGLGIGTYFYGLILSVIISLVIQYQVLRPVIYQKRLIPILICAPFFVVESGATISIWGAITSGDIQYILIPLIVLAACSGLNFWLCAKFLPAKKMFARPEPQPSISFTTVNAPDFNNPPK